MAFLHFSHHRSVRVRSLTAALVSVLVGGLWTGAVGGAQAAPAVDYEAKTAWTTTTKNAPRPGVTTITQTAIQVVPVSRGYKVSLSITDTEQPNSGRSGTLVKRETGSTIVPASALTVAADLSTAQLSATSVPLNLVVRNCPPETPDDCTFTEVPSRTVVVSATWTANEPLGSDCLINRVVDFRGAVATGTLNGNPLGVSQTGDNEIFYILRYTKARCTI